MIYPNIVSHFCQKSIIDTNIHPQGFQELYNSSGYTFKNIDRINRRMFNCVFKTFKQKERYKQQSKGIVVEITDILISSTQCWMNVFCFVKRMTKIEIKNFLNFKF